MTTTATLRLSEDEARKVAAILAEAEGLQADAVDLHEAAPGAWEVVLYFAQADQAQRTHVAAIVAGVTNGAAAPEWRELAETDWVRRSQEALPAVRVGRVLVYGAHHRNAVRENDVAILIEAGQAFGTGHHASTQGSLLAIERALGTRRVRSALDIGTGTGVLAIAMARHGVPVVATDIDPIAVRLARDNARVNRVAARVDVRPTPALPGFLPRDRGGYDLVVANIVMMPLVALAPAIRRAVASGGTVILSGLLPDQRSPIVAAYRAVGLRLKQWFVLNGWLTVVLERPAGRRRPEPASVTNRRRCR